MLYYLFTSLSTTYSGFNVFRYITFRAAIAALSSLLISFLLGPWLIRVLTEKQIGQRIPRRRPSVARHQGGDADHGRSADYLALLISTVMLADIANRYVLLALVATVGTGVVGFADDYLKLTRKNSKGLPPRAELLGQLAIAFVVAVALYYQPKISTEIAFPFVKTLRVNLDVFYIPFAMLVIVGASNAVNLTDGLNRLAIGPVMVAAAAYGVVAYATGHLKFAEYLQIPYVAGVGELTVFCAAVVAAGLGFLWYNAYPAQRMSMGDVGSLSLGAALGIVAVMTKNEILLVIIGGVFVMEALSVIFQVASYKDSPQAGLPDGADTPSLRTQRLERAADYRAFSGYCRSFLRSSA